MNCRCKENPYFLIAKKKNDLSFIHLIFIELYYVPATMLSIRDKATNITEKSPALVVPPLSG